MTKESAPLVRKTLVLSSDLWNRIEDWAHARRIKKDTQAFRELLEIGLQAEAEERPMSPEREAEIHEILRQAKAQGAARRARENKG